MIVYKLEDRFDQKTGKKSGTHRVYDKVICDFSGKEGNFAEDLGSSYGVNYNSCDPCFGCRDDEFELSRKFKFDIHSLYGSDFIFDEHSYNYDDSKVPIIREIIKTYEKETGEKIEFLDQLFRWCRVRMVTKLLSEKKYTLDELGLEHGEDDELDED